MHQNKDAHHLVRVLHRPVSGECTRERSSLPVFRESEVADDATSWLLQAIPRSTKDAGIIVREHHALYLNPSARRLVASPLCVESRFGLLAL